MTREEVERLLARRAFPDAAHAASLVETHISWVLLTEHRAYKLKKPLKFAFADFSTLERRKYYCEREIALNRRLSSGMYLGVLPICQTDEGPRIGQCGQLPAIDFAVEMIRQDNKRQMNILLQEDCVSKQDMRHLAGTIADFHQKATRISKPFDPQDELTRFADLLSVVPLIERHLGTSAPQMIHAAISWLPEFLKKIQPRLIRRIEEGYKIDGHGDLHSKNIFLLEMPVVFDCIEFNDALRQIDVLDEIAFLCMDLDYYRQPDLAAAFLNAYFSFNPCCTSPEDELIFAYYKFYRCNIRLKVNCLRAGQETDPQRQAIWLKAVEDYFALFSKYFGVLSDLPPIYGSDKRLPG